MEVEGRDRKGKLGYHFVRDEIPHSMDARRSELPCSASEALAAETGLCYAKSHLLAALLRGVGIPTAIRYQRLLLSEDPADGYCLHAFNSVWLGDRWVDLDARGNNARISTSFVTEGSSLAFAPNETLGELTYPDYFSDSAASVVESLKAQADLPSLLRRGLPDTLTAS